MFSVQSQAENIILTLEKNQVQIEILGNPKATLFTMIATFCAKKLIISVRIIKVLKTEMGNDCFVHFTW